MSQAAFDAHRTGPARKRPWTCFPEWTFPLLGLWQDPDGRWGFGTAEGYEQRQKQAALMRAAKAKGKDDS